MSSGAFERSRYQASYSTTAIHPIRVQPETESAALTAETTTTNAAPTGAITNPISAVSSLGERQLGLKPRQATLELTGTPPTGYAAGSVTKIPILNTAFFTELTAGTSINYLGTTWEVVSTSPERAA